MMGLSHTTYGSTLILLGKKIQIPITGQHPTLGMVFQQTRHQHQIQLIDMSKGIPGHKLHKWRSTIKCGILISCNNTPITTEQDLVQAIQQAKQQQLHTAHCEFATVQYQPLHPVEGSLMSYYDQLNVIAKHLQQESWLQTTSFTSHCSTNHKTWEKDMHHTNH
jgi:hypothetical protein